MTQDNVIKMAREAGFAHGISCFAAVEEDIVAFAKLVAAHEREACAKLCDSFQERDVGMQPAECASAIRARKQA